MKSETAKKRENSIFSIHLVLLEKFNLNNFHWFSILTFTRRSRTSVIFAVHLTSSSLECVHRLTADNEREVKSYDLKVLIENTTTRHTPTRLMNLSMSMKSEHHTAAHPTTFDNIKNWNELSQMFWGDGKLWR